MNNKTTPVADSIKNLFFIVQMSIVDFAAIRIFAFRQAISAVNSGRDPPPRLMSCAGLDGSVFREKTDDAFPHVNERKVNMMQHCLIFCQQE